MNEPKKKIKWIAIFTVIITFLGLCWEIIDGVYFKDDDKKNARSVQIANQIQNGSNYFYQSPSVDTTRLGTTMPKKPGDPQSPPVDTTRPGTIMPKKPGDPQSPLIDPEIVKKKASKLILNIIVTQNGTEISWAGYGEMKVKIDDSISGNIHYRIQDVPFKYKFERSLQGYPTATELVRGYYMNDEYYFHGYALQDDYNNVYELDSYVIRLNPNDNTLSGTSRGNKNGSCNISGTYSWK